MILYSRTYTRLLVFGFFACAFFTFSILSPIFHGVMARDFHITDIVFLPFYILNPFVFVPLGFLYFFQSFLVGLEFSGNGIAIYKMLKIKFKDVDWSNLDYFVHTIEKGKGGDYKVIYLVSKKTLVLRIPEYLYENFGDINDYISSHLENKGLVELSFWESLKYLTKGQIDKLP